MKPALILVLLLSACARDAAPGNAANAAADATRDAACEAQVNSDPAVQDIIMKGAGSEHYMLENQDRLRLARQRARLACLRSRGVLPKGGGVEPQRPL